MKTCTSFAIVASLLSALPLVSAHGRLRNVKVDGKLFVGPPNNQNSAIRPVADASPVYGAQNRDINCGRDAKPVKNSLNVLPGSKMEFNWKADSDVPWPHNTGPMLTYLANCGGDCADFDAINAKWFKIQEVGRLPNDPSKWEQGKLMESADAFTPVTLPKDLAAGNYLVRHEIIGLHIANSPGRAEFYAACVQVKVGGTETGAPPANQLVSLPGAYRDADAGLVGDFFTSRTYAFPGPPIVRLADATNDTKPSNETQTGEPNAEEPNAEPITEEPNTDEPNTEEPNAEEPNAEEQTPEASPAAPPADEEEPPAPQQCQMMEGNTYRPRKRSRIMRDVEFVSQ